MADNLLEALLYLLQLWASIESNVPVSLVLQGSHVTILGSLLEPVKTLVLILWHPLAGSLHHQFSQHKPCIVHVFLFSEDDSFQFFL